MLASSSRAFSPPLSTVSSTQGTQGTSSSVQVKKVVVEGRSKHDGASLKMYLKLSIAIDNVLPGASIPLFQEDKIRITQSKLHPLDDRSVPYYFSSTEQPLLQRTAAALQLGPKSSRSYHTLFPHASPPPDPTLVASTSTSPNDERYTGYILVSGYNVTLVLPKEFPPKGQQMGIGTESDGDDGFVKDVPSSWSARSARRSSSILHKHYLHMMAGLEVFVPYALTPPKGPFLVSIPVPRCLDNHLKLRISTPPTGSSPTTIPRGSFTSTSSEDDTPGWDFLTDPPVTRRINKNPRRNTHQSADDEHSDTPSAPSTAGTELIQGAYQSTDVLHVRWAPPLGRKSGVPKTEDGMRRVGVERTMGKMKCEVLGKDRHGIRLGIMYDGVCTGLWHPGVATILGMDIALDVKGGRVSWIEDGTAGWAVSGGDAFSGLYSEAHPSGSLSRKSSFDSTVSSTFLQNLGNRPSITPARGSASLLRAPLPNQSTPDYSFENSPNTTPLPSGSSPSYFPSASLSPETKMSRPDVSPGKSVTLKVNLLKLLPPAKNELSFSVKGTVLLDIEEEAFVPLPIFRVLGSDKEKIDTVVSSQTTDVTVQAGTQLPNAPRRMLRTGDEIRAEEGVGLFFRPYVSPEEPTSIPSLSTAPTRHKTPPRSQSHTHSMHADDVPRGQTASGSLSQQVPHLPHVLTTVIPLPHSTQSSHRVQVKIPMYSLDADAIEFGLALPRGATALSSTSKATVDVLYASYAGRYVYAEVLPRSLGSLSPKDSEPDVPGESQINGEMQFLIIVHLEDVEADAGVVEVMYLVGEEGAKRRHGTNKGKGKETIGVDMLLPCFQLPVALYEVEVDCPASFDPHIIYTTLPDRHIARMKPSKLWHFRLPAGFFPVLSLSLVPTLDDAQSHKRTRTRRAASLILSTITYLISFTALYLIVSMGNELHHIRDTIDAAARALVHGVPYSGGHWGDFEPASNPLWWTQVQPPSTIGTDGSTVASATSATSWEKETVYAATPTINLADATPVAEKRSPRTETKGGHARAALIPLPAVPFLSWKMPLSPDTKEIIAKALMKTWYFIRKAWNYPLDPD